MNVTDDDQRFRGSELSALNARADALSRCEHADDWDEADRLGRARLHDVPAGVADYDRARIRLTLTGLARRRQRSVPSPEAPR